MITGTRSHPTCGGGPAARGFVIIDVAIAIGLLGVVMAGIVMGMGRYNRAAHRFGDTRRATLAAEAVLADLQLGRPAADGARVARLDAPAPAGKAWVEVTAADGTATASLVGLVPANVAASTTPGAKPPAADVPVEGDR